MNTLSNTVSLIGHLGKDPEIREFGENNMVARFSIATNESYKDKNNEWVEQTTWHNIVAWGALAKRCKTLNKGGRIALNGKLVSDVYETKKGEKRTKTEVFLREFMSLDKTEQSSK